MLAIEQLSEILVIDSDDSLKRGVAIAIGEIQVSVLDVLFREFPELDDLK